MRENQTPPFNRFNIIKLIASVIICELVGSLGALFTLPAIPTWYAVLKKPSLSPPNWLFAPVWTALFALMGIALFLVWDSYSRPGDGKKKEKIALYVFALQLLLNMLWSAIFFGVHSISGGFLEIIILWLAILATIIAFYRVSRLAGWLLSPYILWVSFALYLNLAIWSLN